MEFGWGSEGLGCWWLGTPLLPLQRVLCHRRFLAWGLGLAVVGLVGGWLHRCVCWEFLPEVSPPIVGMGG